ncbi:PREDICTED: protein TsetseEP-like [Priapulus caudatus]|uniref:Protein TsetseEP-like n=1 Tax=Priapulus caudatus TaxID=37621 RepID=A0ABM1DVU7_PRICU|nr:PREDICTED: protein TsetseEP-like [Priapulus caudatus]
MSQTQKPQRGAWSEPEDEPEPEPEPEPLVLEISERPQPRPEPVQQVRRIFEDIRTEEEHKKFTEEHDIRVRQVVEEPEPVAYAPIQVAPAPQPRPPSPAEQHQAPRQKVHQLPQAGFIQVTGHRNHSAVPGPNQKMNQNLNQNLSHWYWRSLRGLSLDQNQFNRSEGSLKISGQKRTQEVH